MFIAKGDDYGIPKRTVLTYADLVKFDTANILIHNSDRDLYHKDLAEKIENALVKHVTYNAIHSELEEENSTKNKALSNKDSEDKNITILLQINSNNLTDERKIDLINSIQELTKIGEIKFLGKL